MKPVKMAIALALLSGAQASFSQTNFFPVLVCSNATYTNATIESVTPATVTVWWSGGGERISITNLPVELQKCYHYSPEEAQKYLDAQAAKKAAQQERNHKYAEALAEAKRTLGPAQTIRVVNVMNDWHVQIMADGKLAEAYIHKLPPEVLTFVQDYIQTKADAEASQNVNTNATYTRQVNSGTRPGHPVTETVDTHKHTDEAAAAMLTRRHLAELERHAVARTTIIARPSAFILSGGIRQWEYQEMSGKKEK
jgi:hypothetical protein